MSGNKWNKCEKSAFIHQSNVEFCGFFNVFKPDSFVVSVDRGSFLCCHGHGTEPVNMAAQRSVMPGVGALYHQIR
jgi:hypothetical protein